MNDTPIANMLDEYRKKCVLRMHMPGSKGKDDEFDVTETPLTDNLLKPSGGILEACERLRRACGATRSFLLVGGSSAGVAAAIFYAAYSSKLLLSRDAHSSCIDACILAGAEPVFISSEFSERDQLYALPKAADVEQALADDPEIAAVFITYPNYYGSCCNLEEISEVVHRYKKILIADEAHGAHFPYSGLLPPSAGHYADIWVQSAHKTLPALTQGAYLHCGENCDHARLLKCLKLVQTTSPSYLIMNSLDKARDELEKRGEAEYIRLHDRVSKLMTVPFESGIELADFSRLNPKHHDFSRLVFDVRKSGYSGKQADKLMADRGIFVEMSDVYRIACILSIRDSNGDIDLLEQALRSITPRKSAYEFIASPPIETKYALSVREAYFSKDGPVDLKNAAGRICAQIVCAYPPGSSILIPGEVISHEHIEYIGRLLDAEINILGLEEGYVRVVSEYYSGSKW